MGNGFRVAGSPGAALERPGQAGDGKRPERARETPRDASPSDRKSTPKEDARRHEALATIHSKDTGGAAAPAPEKPEEKRSAMWRFINRNVKAFRSASKGTLWRTKIVEGKKRGDALAVALDKVVSMARTKKGGDIAKLFADYTKQGRLGSNELGRLLTDAGVSDPATVSRVIFMAYHTTKGARLNAAELSDLIETAKLPRIGRKIVARLAAMHAGLRQKTWGFNSGNAYPKGWIVQSPEPGTREAQHQGASGVGACEEKICSMPSGHLGDVVGLIRTAKRSVALATWTEPSKEYAAAINQALKELPAGVNVRILIGFTNTKDAAERDAKLKKFLKAITEGVRPGVRVTVGSYNGLKQQKKSFENVKSFSHAKIIVVDGELAVVGGHNWVEHEYNVPTDERLGPVYDLSTVTYGPAASGALHYFDELWKWTAPPAFYDSRYGTVGSRVTREPGPTSELRGRTCHDVADRLKHPGAPAPGGGAVIWAGTTGASFLTDADATSDDAIYALIDSAEKTLRISQQDLVSMNLDVPEKYREFHDQTSQHASSELLDHLGAAIKRGVKVEILLSDGQDGGYQNKPIKETEKIIRDHLAKMGIDRDAPNLEVRGLVGVNGTNARNHAKFIMADRKAFYIGNQNLYPGGLADRKPTTAAVALAEFGFIHLVPDDAPDMAQEILDRYWKPMWTRSKPKKSKSKNSIP